MVYLEFFITISAVMVMCLLLGMFLTVPAGNLFVSTMALYTFIRVLRLERR